MFSQDPLFKKLLDFFPFVDSCRGAICQLIDFSGRVIHWESFISPRNILFHTNFLLTWYKSPNGSHLLREVQSIRSPENPATTMVSQYWIQNPMARKPWVSHPKCGITAITTYQLSHICLVNDLLHGSSEIIFLTKVVQTFYIQISLHWWFYFWNIHKEIEIRVSQFARLAEISKCIYFVYREGIWNLIKCSVWPILANSYCAVMLYKHIRNYGIPNCH